MSKTESILIRLTLETRAWVREQAEKDHRPDAAWVRALILKEMEKKSNKGGKNESKN